MAPRHGSTELRVKNSGVSPVVVDQQVNAATDKLDGFHLFFVNRMIQNVH